MYIGLTSPVHRLILRRPFQLCRRQQSIHLLRNISSTTSQKNWKNDTPPGGLTEILVYSPDPEVNWPDTSLSIFAKADPKFVLPGNVAIAYPEEKCDIDSVIDANGDAILVSGSVFHVYVRNMCDTHIVP